MKKLIIILFPPILYVIYALVAITSSGWTLSEMGSEVGWSWFVIDTVIISTFWFVNIYLFTNLKGDINFSHMKTGINLVVSIIWVFVIWFNALTLLFTLPIVSKYYTHSHFQEVYFEPLPLKISIFILLTIPIWKYWILKPLFTYRLSVKLKKR